MRHGSGARLAPPTSQLGAWTASRTALRCLLEKTEVYLAAMLPSGPRRLCTLDLRLLATGCMVYFGISWDFLVYFLAICFSALTWPAHMGILLGGLLLNSWVDAYKFRGSDWCASQRFLPIHCL